MFIFQESNKREEAAAVESKSLDLPTFGLVLYFDPFCLGNIQSNRRPETTDICAINNNNILDEEEADESSSEEEEVQKENDILVISCFLEFFENMALSEFGPS